MTRKEWLEHFDQLLPPVQNYLLSDVAAKHENDAQRVLAYDNDAWARVMDVVWELLFEKLNLIEWKSRISQVRGDRTSEELERAMLLHVVLPLADMIPWDVETRLQELGVKASEIQQVPRVSLRPVSYGAAARRICSEARLSVLSEELFTRLRDALVSFIKGVRSRDQLSELLRRQQAEGGMGFSLDQANQFLTTMDNFLEVTQVMSEQEYADWFVRYQREAELARLEQDQKKQAAERASDEPTMAGAPRGAVDAPAALVNGIKTVFERIGPLQLDDMLLRRLENAVSTRLRDVRNAIQTKQILSREAKVGGVGFTEQEAERIAGIIEQTYTEQRAQIEVEERERIQTVMNDQQKKIEERRKRESEEHARWFQEKVKSIRPEEALKEQFQKSQMQAPSTAFGDASPSAGNQIKPRLDGVVPPLRLMGVEDELGTMSWASFRLLSKNPQEAANKIEQRLETLKAESFDRWTQGLESWRQSPLQQDYLKLVTESFSAAKPVAQLVEEKRMTNPNLPSPEELGAIIALNARLQA